MKSLVFRNIFQVLAQTTSCRTYGRMLDQQHQVYSNREGRVESVMKSWESWESSLSPLSKKLSPLSHYFLFKKHLRQSRLLRSSCLYLYDYGIVTSNSSCIWPMPCLCIDAGSSLLRQRIRYHSFEQLVCRRKFLEAQASNTSSSFNDNEVQLVHV